MTTAIILGLALVTSGVLLAAGVFFVACADKIILRNPGLNKTVVYITAASVLSLGLYFLFACNSMLSDLLRPGILHY